VQKGSGVNASKVLLIWSMVTTGMIFWYIWHQNAAIQHMYQKQQLENNLATVEKEIRALHQKIAERSTPAKILENAKELGLQKTPPEHILQLKDYLSPRKQEL